MIQIQTAGGASYQKDCICDISTISSNYPDWGDASVTYECRMYTPDANVTSIDGTDNGYQDTFREGLLTHVI